MVLPLSLSPSLHSSLFLLSGGKSNLWRFSEKSGEGRKAWLLLQGADLVCNLILYSISGFFYSSDFGTILQAILVHCSNIRR